VTNENVAQPDDDNTSNVVPESVDKLDRLLDLEAVMRAASPTSWGIVSHVLRGDVLDALDAAEGDALAVASAVSMLALFMPGIDDPDALPKLAGLATRAASASALAQASRE
jgi:hypothetical protein